VLKQVSDAGDVSPSPELLRPFITRSFKHRLKERMRKRDVTLGIMIGLVAALCAGVDKARQSDLEFYDLPAFTLPTFGFGNMSRTAVRRPGIGAGEGASSPPPPAAPPPWLRHFVLGSSPLRRDGRPLPD